ncbi:MAG: hypothetical protein CMH54_09710 [Myxococcales bacterium]|nr:hypothetical protein [Myxococcales bacterium]
MDPDVIYRIALWVTYLGLAITGLFVAAYWLYTLAGQTWLRPLLGQVRRLWFLLSPVVVFTSTVALTNVFGQRAGSTEPVHLVTALLLFALLNYMHRRQWLWGYKARPTAPIDAEIYAGLSPELELAVTPEGHAIPLGWLARSRIATIGEDWIVHCSIARSLSLFRAPESSTCPRATLPHRTGFYVGNLAGDQCWDGVDGSTVRGPSPLHLRSIHRSTLGHWQKNWPDGQLYADASFSSAMHAKAIRPLVPDARQIENPQEWGLVTQGTWSTEAPDNASVPPGSYYLSRWAASARHLTILS